MSRYKVYSHASDGKHLIGKCCTLDKAKQIVEDFCSCTIQGVELHADWQSDTTAISAFGDKLTIE